MFSLCFKGRNPCVVESKLFYLFILIYRPFFLTKAGKKSHKNFVEIKYSQKLSKLWFNAKLNIFSWTAATMATSGNCKMRSAALMMLLARAEKESLGQWTCSLILVRLHLCLLTLAASSSCSNKTHECNGMSKDVLYRLWI